MSDKKKKGHGHKHKHDKPAPEHAHGHAEQQHRGHPHHHRKSKKKSGHIVRYVAIGLILIVAIVVGVLVFTKTQSSADASKKQHSTINAGPRVEMISVKAAPTEQQLTLEAECRPFYEATMYAKVSGYLKEIRVFEGTHVKQGDILAVIESPEIDQAYFAAAADARNRQRIAGRSRALLKQDLISQQEADQVFANERVSLAKLRSAQEMKDYEILRAPFDAVVTARMVDPGDLIPDASNSKSTQLALITLADMRKLKVDAYVEQKYAADIQPGMLVDVYLPDRIGEKFIAHVSRVSGALDPRTRMLFMEIDFENADGKLVAGSFVNVNIKIQRQKLSLVPVQALVTKNGGPALAKITQDKHLRFDPVDIFENDGTNLMILKGANVGEKIAMNIGAQIKDGDLVQPIDSEAKPQQQNETAGQGQQQNPAQNPAQTAAQTSPQAQAQPAGQGQTGGGQADVGHEKINEPATSTPASSQTTPQVPASMTPSPATSKQ